MSLIIKYNPKPHVHTHKDVDVHCIFREVREICVEMQKNTRQPAQHLIDEIHRSMKNLLQLLDEEQNQEIRLKSTQTDSDDESLNSPLSFTWIAGHKDSTGNFSQGSVEKRIQPKNATPNIPPQTITDQSISSQANDKRRHQNRQQKMVVRIAKIQTNSTDIPFATFRQIHKNHEFTQS